MNIIDRLRPWRAAMLALSAVGFVGLNGVFVYFLLFEPDVLGAAMQNPIGLVFIVEAFVMTGFGAAAIARLRLNRPGWFAFVLLSLLGGLAFSVPLFVVLQMRRTSETQTGIRPTYSG